MRRIAAGENTSLANGADTILEALNDRQCDRPPNVHACRYRPYILDFFESLIADDFS
jgi:hypothetical protein